MFEILFVISLAAALFLSVLLFLKSNRLRLIQKKLTNAEEKLQQALEKEYLHRHELEDIKNKMELSVIQDPLTGLPNRRIFEDRLAQVLNQSSRYKMVFAVLFLNLDNFKMINDALGLRAGDEILAEAAKRMQSSIRQTDSVSRFSGDEFVFILTQLGKSETAAYVAERLLDAIAQPYLFQGQEIFITASIGIATYPSDGETIDLLLKNADNALHQAKAEGRNAFQFYRQEMYDISRRELTLSSSLRNAAVYQEFLIYYQPMVNIETKQIISMEAILHWQHPTLGLLSQNDFIKLAESSGNIIGIGDWVLYESCKQFKKWLTQGFELQSLAVKISLRQLENPHFTYKVSQVLHEFELLPHTLILEISEVMLLTKSGLIEKSLHMLKQIGVQIGMSGFGTGKISLQDLRSYPIDYLKISNLLIEQLNTNIETDAIVKMIISLGNTFGLRVIAEGVTREQQKNILMNMGCIMMEGQLFSEPVLPAEFTRLLEKNILEHA